MGKSGFDREDGSRDFSSDVRRNWRGDSKYLRAGVCWTQVTERQLEFSGFVRGSLRVFDGRLEVFRAGVLDSSGREGLETFECFCEGDSGNLGLRLEVIQ